MAFTAVGALIAGGAVETAVVLAAITEVGMAMTVVGVVTGNKTLLKIGGAMSLIGGVGGMVAGAVGGAAATGVAETALSETATQAALDAASQEAAGAAGGTLGADAATADVVAGMEGAATPASTMGAGNAQQGIVEGLKAGPAAETAQAPLQAGAQTPAATDLQPIVGPEAPVGAQAPNTPYDVNSNPTDMRLQAGTQTTPMNAPEASGSYFSRLSAFANQNKTLFSSGVQVVGGALKGINEKSMWDEKMANERTRLQQIGYGNQVANFAPRSIYQGAAR